MNNVVTDTKFQKGQSGNPNGRPKGSRNRASLIVQNLLEGEAEEISRKLLELAKGGDIQAIKLVIERLLPPLKEIPLDSDLSFPKLNSPADITTAYNQLMDMVAEGAITISEAEEISSILENQRKAIETTEIKTRLEELKNIIRSGRG